MSWNYRIFRHRYPNGPSTYAIHEAYYTKKKGKNKVDGWTVEPMTPHRDNAEELIEMLEIMLRDATKSREDVLEYEPKRKRKKK